jgi:hypothetical protein
LVHRRQARSQERRVGDVVEPDHRERVGQVESRPGQRPDQPDRVPVGSEHDRGGGHAGGHQLPGDRHAAALVVVRRGEQQGRVRDDATVQQSPPVSLVAFAQVEGVQVAAERDPFVAVLHEVVDAVADAAPVVGEHHRALDAGQLVADQGHLDTRVDQCPRVVGIDSARHHHHAVQVPPGDGPPEIGEPAGVGAR